MWIRRARAHVPPTSPSRARGRSARARRRRKYHRHASRARRPSPPSRATDTPRISDRGIDRSRAIDRCGWASVQVAPPSRVCVATRDRGRVDRDGRDDIKTYLAGTHGDRTRRARRAGETHARGRLDGGGADGEHDRRVEVCGRARGRGRGLPSCSVTIKTRSGGGVKTMSLGKGLGWDGFLGFSTRSTSVNARGVGGWGTCVWWRRCACL